MNFYDPFMTLMNNGGPLMWVIFSASCIAFILISRLFLYVFQQQKHAVRNFEQIGEAAFDPAGLSQRAFLGPLIKRLYDKTDISERDFKKHIQHHLGDNETRLERALATIAVIGSLLPMLGLLGTVTGMINVFDVIAVHGSGKPDAMAAGISQALLTTASGLLFSIPVIFLHHLLVQRANTLADLNNQTAQLLIETRNSKTGSRQAGS